MFGSYSDGAIMERLLPLYLLGHGAASLQHIAPRSNAGEGELRYHGMPRYTYLRIVDLPVYYCSYVHDCTCISITLFCDKWSRFPETVSKFVCCCYSFCSSIIITCSFLLPVVTAFLTFLVFWFPSLFSSPLPPLPPPDQPLPSLSDHGGLGSLGHGKGLSSCSNV